jgi:hypothetical protein
MRKNTFRGALALISILILSGCRKQMNSAHMEPVTADSNGYVMTPAGIMPSAKVHAIEPGYQIRIQNGHVFKIHSASGKVIEDFGEWHPSTARISGLKIAAGKPGVQNGAPQPPAGWITYAQWSNTTGQPINYFNTVYQVPAAPATGADGQLVYIFEGLQNAISGSDIMQPVLQWGANLRFGGAYWCIANWYIWAGGSAYSGPEININPGTALEGSITNGGETDGSYSYTSSFVNHPASAMTIAEGNSYTNYNDPNKGKIALPAIPLQAAAFITLEAYHAVSGGFLPEVVHATDYPVPAANMTNIQMGLTNELAPLAWATETTQYAAFGENTVIQSNGADGSGEVDLWFEPFKSPFINGQSDGEVLLYEGSPKASGTITAIPGQSVNVEAYTFAKDQGLTQTVTFQFTTNGVDFIPGGNNITATNSSVTERFIMPSSGTVNWSATYTQTGGSSHLYDGANIHVF